MRISDWSSDVCSSDLAFLEIRSADVIPGSPALISSETLSDVFGRSLNSATEIQRSIERSRTDDQPTAPGNRDQQQGEAPQEQTDASFQPPLETGGGDQPLGEGSGFAAGLTLAGADLDRSEEHTSELQSLMRIAYAVFWLKEQN